jgi:hypothetical protein
VTLYLNEVTFARHGRSQILKRILPQYEVSVRKLCSTKVSLVLGLGEGREKGKLMDGAKSLGFSEAPAHNPQTKTTGFD